MSTVEQRVTRIICEYLGLQPNEFRPSSNLMDDLGADSLDTVEIMLAIEDEFDIDISDDDAERVEDEGTVQAIIDYVKRRIAG